MMHYVNFCCVLCFFRNFAFAPADPICERLRKYTKDKDTGTADHYKQTSQEYSILMTYCKEFFKISSTGCCLEFLRTNNALADESLQNKRKYFSGGMVNHKKGVRRDGCQK